MDKANIMVGLGGGRDTTVPKENVSAAEIAILRAIHGDDAVHDIVPAGEFLVPDGEPDEGEEQQYRPVKNRELMLSLKEKYAGTNTTPIVESLFPGAAARVPETLEELDLPDELYKPVAREKPNKATDKPTPKAGKKVDAGGKTDDVLG